MKGNEELKIELTGMPLKRPMSNSGWMQVDHDDEGKKQVVQMAA